MTTQDGQFILFSDGAAAPSSGGFLTPAYWDGAFDRASFRGANSFLGYLLSMVLDNQVQKAHLDAQDGKYFVVIVQEGKNNIELNAGLGIQQIVFHPATAQQFFKSQVGV